MRRNWTIGVVLAALVLAVAGAGYWWSHKSSWAYQGLASRFPERVQVFMEIHQLGQWMPPAEGQAGTAAAGVQSSRGTDPMLQVLQTVWAAPVVSAKDIPALLRTKPMAAGFWLDGSTLKGAALMPLAPGEKAALEQALKDKLGDGPEVGQVAGMTLHKVDVPLGKANIHLNIKMDQLVWGVDDAWAVLASGVEGARAVLEGTGKPLSQDGVFLSVLKRFPDSGGATLFVRGTLLERVQAMVRETTSGKAGPEPAVPSGTASREGGEPAPQAKPEDRDGKATPGTSPETSRQEGIYQTLGILAMHTLPKLAALDSISSLALWTAPPKEGERGWQVQSWLGFKDQPKGIWRLAAQGSSRTPQIAERLPKHGQIYVWGAGRDPARLYQDILDELGNDLPPDQMGTLRAVIGAAEGKLGMSFSNDLLPTLSDEWCFASEPSPEGAKPSEKGTRMALFQTLRDPRRFEDLVSQKLAPQLKLQPMELKGARGWSLGLPGAGNRLSLVVSGGMAIFTDDAAWALDTGGTSSKPWKALSNYRSKASCLILAESKSDVLVSVSCLSGPEGIYTAGRFPGHKPDWCSGDKHAGGSEMPAAPSSGRTGGTQAASEAKGTI